MFGTDAPYKNVAQHADFIGISVEALISASFLWYQEVQMVAVGS
jgi:hypothetical protein